MHPSRPAPRACGGDGESDGMAMASRSYRKSGGRGGVLKNLEQGSFEGDLKRVLIIKGFYNQAFKF